jgi:hypothetical protein
MSEQKTLRITSGLHEGARVNLIGGEYVIGSGEDCDIVLLDEGVAQRHARLVIDGVRLRIESIDGAALHTKGRAMLSKAKALGDYEIVSIGAAQFYLSPTGETAAAEDSPSASAAGASARAVKPEHAAAARTRTRFARSVYGASALLAAAAFFTYAEEGWRERGTAPMAALAQARAKLAALNLNDVAASLNARGQLVLSGYVNTAQDARRLREEKSLHALGAPLVQVHIAEQVLARLRQDLDAAGIAAGYLGGGRVALSGSGAAALKPRVQSLRRDLAQVIAIEDRIDYRAPVAARAAPSSAPLPVRIVAVHIGPVSYFEDADGARYFIGGSLRDGAQVTAISETSISFSKNGQSITHSLGESSAHAKL